MTECGGVRSLTILWSAIKPLDTAKRLARCRRMMDTLLVGWCVSSKRKGFLVDGVGCFHVDKKVSM